MEKSLEQLKAEAWDLIHYIENAQHQLKQLNQEIQKRMMESIQIKTD